MSFEIDTDHLIKLIAEKRYDTVGRLLNEKSDEVKSSEDFASFTDTYLEFLSHYRELNKFTADDALVEFAIVASDANSYYSPDDHTGKAWRILAQMIVASVNRLETGYIAKSSLSIVLDELS